MSFALYSLFLSILIISIPSVSSQACSVVLNEIVFSGPVIDVVSAIEFQGCCKACQTIKGCSVYSFHEESGNCSLYNLESVTLLPNESFVSGIVSENGHVFSVVWVATIIMGITLIFWLGFSVFMFQQFPNRAGKTQKTYYSTVSGYCASMEPWFDDQQVVGTQSVGCITHKVPEGTTDLVMAFQRKAAKIEFPRIFLVIVSASIGFNLAALLTEEFNSTPENNPVLSWIQIVSCICFPLVGIFPIRKHRYFLYFHYRFPMVWSHAIHQLFALNFFITLSIVNVIQSVHMVQKEANHAAGFLVGNIIVLLIVVGFVLTSKLFLAWAKKLIKKKKQGDGYTAFDEANKPQDSILRNLSFLSVALESLALFGVTIMTAVMSVKRNRFIDWGDDSWSYFE